MKDTTQVEPSAWSLAEEVPEGTDLGSLLAPSIEKANLPHIQMAQRRGTRCKYSIKESGH